KPLYLHVSARGPISGREALRQRERDVHVLGALDDENGWQSLRLLAFQDLLRISLMNGGLVLEVVQRLSQLGLRTAVSRSGLGRGLREQVAHPGVDHSPAGDHEAERTVSVWCAVQRQRAV